MSFSNVIDLYSLENTKISFSHVENEKLTIFAQNLENLRKEINYKYENDEHINELLDLLRRSFFKLIGSFLPYNKVINKEKQDDLLRMFIQVKKSYPELFSSLIIDLGRSFKELMESPENSLVAHLHGYLNNFTKLQKTALVTKRALSLEEKGYFRNGLQNKLGINYYTENSFRKEIQLFDQVIYIGSPNYFGDHVKNIFKAPIITFVSYDMFSNSLTPKQFFEDLSSEGVYSTLYNHVTIDKPILKKAQIKLDEKESLNIAVNKILDEQSSSESQTAENVEASIVYLENDRFIFVPQESKVRVFLPEEKNNTVQQKKFKELEEDVFIVIRNESDSKLIAEVADQILKSDAKYYRQLQRKWKKRLRYNVEKLGIQRVSNILSRKYNIKTASTVSIRNWCNEESICPTELVKILTALKFSEKESKEIYAKMKEIQRAHIKAGRLITRKLMNELSTDIVEKLNEQGYYTFTSEEFDGASFNIERVIAIDQKSYFITPNNLMKPFEIS